MFFQHPTYHHHTLHPDIGACSLNFDTAFSENKLTPKKLNRTKWAVGLFPNRVDNPVFLEAKFRTV